MRWIVGGERKASSVVFEDERDIVFLVKRETERFNYLSMHVSKVDERTHRLLVALDSIKKCVDSFEATRQTCLGVHG